MTLLFTPLQVNSMRLENRIVLPAMVTRLSGEDGYVNQDIRDRYLRYAKGEAGMVVVEAMAVHHSKAGPLLRIAEDRFVPGLRDLVKLMHDHSPSKVVPQIIHFMKVSRSGWRQTFDLLTKADIKAVIDGFAAAAYRARAVGFDGLELHGAHAYTLAASMSRRSNTRRDEYGRTLEGRLRLVCEVIAAVRQAVGADFPVGIRIVGEEYIQDGYTAKESPLIALRLAQMGVDYISISAGGKHEDAAVRPGEPANPYTGYSGDRCMPGVEFPDGLNLEATRGIKAYLRANGYGHVPIIAAGKLSDRGLIDRVLADGWADLIGMARPLLCHPDLPRKWREGQDDKVIRCIYCNVCKSLDVAHKQVRCSLWPKTTLHAPEQFEFSLPAWPEGAGLTAALKGSSLVRLQWQRAHDDAGVQGYAIFRSPDGQNWKQLWGGHLTGYSDYEATAGTWYYRVQAYDETGNRSPYSNVARIEVPLADFAVPAAAMEQAE